MKHKHKMIKKVWKLPAILAMIACIMLPAIFTIAGGLGSLQFNTPDSGHTHAPSVETTDLSLPADYATNLFGQKSERVGRNVTYDLTAADGMNYDGKIIEYNLYEHDVISDVFVVRRDAFYWDPMPSQDIVSFFNQYTGPYTLNGSPIADADKVSFKFYTRINGKTEGTLYYLGLDNITYYSVTVRFLVRSRATANAPQSPVPTPISDNRYKTNPTLTTTIEANRIAVTPESFNNLRIAAASVFYPEAVDNTAYCTDDIGINLGVMMTGAVGVTTYYNSVKVLMRTQFYRQFGVELLVINQNPTNDEQSYTGLVYYYIGGTTDDNVTQSMVSTVEDRSKFVNSGLPAIDYMAGMYSNQTSTLRNAEVNGYGSGIAQYNSFRSVYFPSTSAVMGSEGTYETASSGRQMDVVFQKNQEAISEQASEVLFYCSSHQNAYSSVENAVHKQIYSICNAIVINDSNGQPTNWLRCDSATHYFACRNDYSVGDFGYDLGTNKIKHPYGGDPVSHNVYDTTDGGTPYTVTSATTTFYICEHGYFLPGTAGTITHASALSSPCYYDLRRTPPISYNRVNQNTVPFYFYNPIVAGAITPLNPNLNITSSVAQKIEMSRIASITGVEGEIENVYAYDKGYISVGLHRDGLQSYLMIAPLNNVTNTKNIVLTIKSKTASNVEVRRLVSVSYNINMTTSLNGINPNAISKTNSAPEVDGDPVLRAFSGHRGEHQRFIAGATLSGTIAKDADGNQFSFHTSTDPQDILVFSDKLTVVPASKIKVTRATQLGADGMPLEDVASMNSIYLSYESVTTGTYYLRVIDSEGNIGYIPITINCTNQRPYPSIGVENSPFSIPGATAASSSAKDSLKYFKFSTLAQPAIPDIYTMYNTATDNDNFKFGTGLLGDPPFDNANRRDVLGIKVIGVDNINNPYFSYYLEDEAKFYDGTVCYQTIKFVGKKRCDAQEITLEISDGYGTPVQFKVYLGVLNTSAVISRQPTIRIAAQESITFYAKDLAVDIDDDKIEVVSTYVETVRDGKSVGLSDYMGANGYISNVYDTDKITFRGVTKSQPHPGYNLNGTANPILGHFAVIIEVRDRPTTDPTKYVKIRVDVRIDNSAPTAKNLSETAKSGAAEVPVYATSVADDKDLKTMSFAAAADITMNGDVAVIPPGASHEAEKISITKVAFKNFANGNTTGDYSLFAKAYFRSPDNQKIMYKLDASGAETSVLLNDINEILTSGIVDKYKTAYYPNATATTELTFGTMFLKPLRATNQSTALVFTVTTTDSSGLYCTSDVTLTITNSSPSFRNDNDKQIGTETNPYIVNLAKDGIKGDATFVLSPYMLACDIDTEEQLYSPSVGYTPGPGITGTVKNTITGNEELPKNVSSWRPYLTNNSALTPASNMASMDKLRFSFDFLEFRNNVIPYVGFTLDAAGANLIIRAEVRSIDSTIQNGDVIAQIQVVDRNGGYLKVYVKIRVLNSAPYSVQKNPDLTTAKTLAVNEEIDVNNPENSILSTHTWTVDELAKDFDTPGEGDPAFNYGLRDYLIFDESADTNTSVRFYLTGTSPGILPVSDDAKNYVRASITIVDGVKVLLVEALKCTNYAEGFVYVGFRVSDQTVPASSQTRTDLSDVIWITVRVKNSLPKQTAETEKQFSFNNVLAVPGDTTAKQPFTIMLRPQDSTVQDYQQSQNGGAEPNVSICNHIVPGTTVAMQNCTPGCSSPTGFISNYPHYDSLADDLAGDYKHVKPLYVIATDPDNDEILFNSVVASMRNSIGKYEEITASQVDNPDPDKAAFFTYQIVRDSITNPNEWYILLTFVGTGAGKLVISVSDSGAISDNEKPITISFRVSDTQIKSLQYGTEDSALTLKSAYQANTGSDIDAKGSYQYAGNETYIDLYDIVQYSGDINGTNSVDSTSAGTRPHMTLDYCFANTGINGGADGSYPTINGSEVEGTGFRNKLLDLNEHGGYSYSTTSPDLYSRKDASLMRPSVGNRTMSRVASIEMNVGENKHVQIVSGYQVYYETGNPSNKFASGRPLTDTGSTTLAPNQTGTYKASYYDLGNVPDYPEAKRNEGGDAEKATYRGFVLRGLQRTDKPIQLTLYIRIYTGISYDYDLYTMPLWVKVENSDLEDHAKDSEPGSTGSIPQPEIQGIDGTSGIKSVALGKVLNVGTYEFKFNKASSFGVISTVADKSSNSVQLKLYDNDADDTRLINYQSAFVDNSAGAGIGGSSPATLINSGYHYNNKAYSNQGREYSYEKFFDISTASYTTTTGTDNQKVYSYYDSQYLYITPKKATTELAFKSGDVVINDGYFPLYFMVYDDYNKQTLPYQAQNNSGTDLILNYNNGLGFRDPNDNRKDVDVSRAIVCVRVYIANSNPTPVKRTQNFIMSYQESKSIMLKDLITDKDIAMINGNYFDVNKGREIGIDTLSVVGVAADDDQLTVNNGQLNPNGWIEYTGPTYYKYDENVADKSIYYTTGTQTVTFKVNKKFDEKLLEQRYKIKPTDTPEERAEKEKANRAERTITFYLIVGDLANPNAVEDSFDTEGNLVLENAPCYVEINIYVTNQAPVQEETNRNITLNVGDALSFATYQYQSEPTDPVFSQNALGNKGTILVAKDNEVDSKYVTPKNAAEMPAETIGQYNKMHFAPYTTYTTNEDGTSFVSTTNATNYLNSVHAGYLTFTAPSTVPEYNSSTQLGPNKLMVTARKATTTPITLQFMVSDGASENNLTMCTYTITINSREPELKKDVVGYTLGISRAINNNTRVVALTDIVTEKDPDETLSVASRPVASAANGKIPTVFRNQTKLGALDPMFIGESNFVINNRNISSNEYIELSSAGSQLNITPKKFYSDPNILIPTITVKFYVIDTANNAVLVTLNILIESDIIQKKGTGSDSDLPLTLNAAGSTLNGEQGLYNFNIKDYIRGSEDAAVSPFELDDAESSYSVDIYDGRANANGTTTQGAAVHKIATYTPSDGYRYFGTENALGVTVPNTVFSNHIYMQAENGIVFDPAIEENGVIAAPSIKNIKFYALKRTTSSFVLTIVVKKKVFSVTKASGLVSNYNFGTPGSREISLVFNFNVTVPNSAPTVNTDNLPIVIEGKSQLELFVNPVAPENREEGFNDTYSVSMPLAIKNNFDSLVYDIDQDNVLFQTEVGTNDSGWLTVDAEGGAKEIIDAETDAANYLKYHEAFTNALSITIKDNIITFTALSKLITTDNLRPYVTMYVKLLLRDSAVSTQKVSLIIPITITNSAPKIRNTSVAYEVFNGQNCMVDGLATISMNSLISDDDMRTEAESFTVSVQGQNAQAALTEEGWEIKDNNANIEQRKPIALLKATAGWKTFTIVGLSSARGATSGELSFTIRDSSGITASFTDSNNVTTTTIKIKFTVGNSAPTPTATNDAYLIIGSSKEVSSSLTVFLNESDHIDYYSNKTNNPNYVDGDSSTIPPFIKLFDDINGDKISYQSTFTDIKIKTNDVPKLIITANSDIRGKGFTLTTTTDLEFNKMRSGEEIVEITVYDSDPNSDSTTLFGNTTLKIYIVEDPSKLATRTPEIQQAQSFTPALSTILNVGADYYSGCVLNPTGYSIYELPVEKDPVTELAKYNVKDVLELSSDRRSITGKSVGRGGVRATVTVTPAGSSISKTFNIDFVINVTENAKPALRTDILTLGKDKDLTFNTIDGTGPGTARIPAIKLFKDDDELTIISAFSDQPLIIDVSIDPETNELVFTVKARGAVTVTVVVKDALKEYTSTFTVENYDMPELGFFASMWNTVMQNPMQYIIIAAAVVGAILLLVVVSMLVRRARRLRAEAEARMVDESELEDQYMQIAAANNNMQLGSGMGGYQNPMIGAAAYQQLAQPSFNQMQLGSSNMGMSGVNDPLQLSPGQSDATFISNDQIAQDFGFGSSGNSDYNAMFGGDSSGGGGYDANGYNNNGYNNNNNGGFNNNGY